MTTWNHHLAFSKQTSFLGGPLLFPLKAFGLWILLGSWFRLNWLFLSVWAGRTLGTVKSGKQIIMSALTPERMVPIFYYAKNYLSPSLCSSFKMCQASERRGILESAEQSRELKPGMPYQIAQKFPKRTNWTVSYIVTNIVYILTLFPPDYR